MSFPVPPDPEPTTYLKPSELVSHEPPYVFTILRVGEGDTAFGPKWYVNVEGPAEGDFCISWKQGEGGVAGTERDNLLLPLQRASADGTLTPGITFSLYRTGPGGKVITLGPAKDGAVPYQQTELTPEGNAAEVAAEQAAAEAPVDPFEGIETGEGDVGTSTGPAEGSEVPA